MNWEQPLCKNTVLHFRFSSCNLLVTHSILPRPAGQIGHLISDAAAPGSRDKTQSHPCPSRVLCLSRIPFGASSSGKRSPPPIFLRAPLGWRCGPDVWSKFKPYRRRSSQSTSMIVGRLPPRLDDVAIHPGAPLCGLLFVMVKEVALGCTAWLFSFWFLVAFVLVWFFFFISSGCAIWAGDSGLGITHHSAALRKASVPLPVFFIALIRDCSLPRGRASKSRAAFRPNAGVAPQKFHIFQSFAERLPRFVQKPFFHLPPDRGGSSSWATVS